MLMKVAYELGGREGLPGRSCPESFSSLLKFCTFLSRRRQRAAGADSNIEMYPFETLKIPYLLLLSSLSIHLLFQLQAVRSRSALAFESLHMTALPRFDGDIDRYHVLAYA